MIAGPDDVVRLELEHIGFLPAKADLMATLVELSVALNHRVVPVRRLVIHAGARGELGATHSRKRAGHAREGVRGGDFFVARRADGGIGIGRRATLGERRRAFPLRLDWLRRPAREHQRKQGHSCDQE